METPVVCDVCKGTGIVDAKPFQVYCACVMGLHKFSQDRAKAKYQFEEMINDRTTTNSMDSDIGGDVCRICS